MGELFFQGGINGARAGGKAAASLTNNDSGVHYIPSFSRISRRIFLTLSGVKEP